MQHASSAQRLPLHVQDRAFQPSARPIARRINDTMQALIRQHGLEVLERYPLDVTVHDLAVLEWAAKPGATIAWMVGHCHTHIVPLGLHPGENENVTHLTNLASEDRFYVIKVDRAGAFTFKELDRNTFSALSSTAVPYRREGGVQDCWLRKNGEKVGHIHLERIGDWRTQQYRAVITPCAGITDLDRSALNVWCDRSVREAAGTLFVRYEAIWEDAAESLAA